MATNYFQDKPLTDIDLKSVAISAGAGALGAGLANKAGKLAELLRLGSKADDIINVADDAAKGVANLADDVATQTGKGFTKGQLEQFQRQLVEHGKTSLEKSRATLEKRLAEHVKKLESLKKSEGHTSSVEREIHNFQQQIEAIDETLRRTQ